MKIMLSFLNLVTILSISRASSSVNNNSNDDDDDNDDSISFGGQKCRGVVDHMGDYEIELWNPTGDSTMPMHCLAYTVVAIIAT